MNNKTIPPPTTTKLKKESQKSCDVPEEYDPPNFHVQYSGEREGLDSHHLATAVTPVFP